MLRTAFRVLVRVALVVGVAASFGTGCARQAEGERCDFTWAGDQDCDDGLVCTPCGKLQQQSIDRCCLPGGSYTDTRCIPTTTPSEKVCNTHLNEGTAGMGGGAGTGGTAGSGTAGSSTAGAGGTAGTAGTASTAGEGGNGATSGADNTGDPADGG